MGMSFPNCSSFSPEKGPLSGEDGLFLPAIIVIPQAQCDGIWPPPVVGLQGQDTAVPVDALSPTFGCAPRAPVGDTLVLIARGTGI